jgi:hypothetical protein
MTRPTAEGLRRYPHSGGYFAVVEGDDHPCTCTPTCEPRCAGECGCEACSLAFEDFCDYASTALPEGATAEQLLRAYKHADYGA